MRKTRTRLAAMSALLAFGPAAFAALPNGIAAGDVTQDSAVLWGRSDTAGSVSFEYSSDGTFASILGSTSQTIADPLLPAKWDVSGLNPGSTYYYRVTDSAGGSLVGQFNTPAALGNQAGLRFGVSGDSRGDLLPLPSLGNASQRGLDFFVSMGDSIYADVASAANNHQQQAQTLADFQNKQAEVYAGAGGLNTLGSLRQSTALYATIDDHEVTNDFAGGADVASDPRFSADPAGTRINDSTLYNNGLQAFLDYNPIRTETYGNTFDPVTSGEVKLYRSQTFGNDAAMMLLDARSFRDQELPAANPNDPASVAAFLANTFDPSRTLLGAQQVSDLKSDLLSAQQGGVTWKFIMLPEPIQNLGVLGAGDRFEGYAAERTEILKFIDDHDIANVVFVSADVHGTLVNNLTYQTAPFTAQIPTNAFEITTGPIAHNAPFGPTVVNLAAALSLLTPAQKAYYDALPSAAAKDAFVKAVVDTGLSQMGYDTLGLAANGAIQAELLHGDYLSTHSYGWTEFAIDRMTQQLLVTTWGIPAYSASDLVNNLPDVINRMPQIVSQFRITPQSVPEPGSLGLLVGGLFGVMAFRRRRPGR